VHDETEAPLSAASGEQPISPESPTQDKAGSAVTSRRKLFGKGAVVAAGGIAAALYVKPNMRELGVPGTYAAVSPSLGPNNPPRPPTNWPPNHDWDDLTPEQKEFLEKLLDWLKKLYGNN
jgi:hypothetical protein